jgi:hypothetical protein
MFQDFGDGEDAHNWFEVNYRSTRFKNDVVDVVIL